MKNSCRSLLLLPLTSLLAGFSGLDAGVVYTMESSESPDAESSKIEVKAQGDQVRMNFEGDSGSNEFIIFDGATNSLIIAYPEEESYIAIDRDTMNQIKETMAEAQRQMDQALAQVPAAQREQMKQMMQSRFPGAGGDDQEAPSIEVSSTGEQKTIEDYDCEAYDVMVDGRKEATLWVTDWDNLEGKDEARQSLTNMTEFFTSFFESLPQLGQESERNRSTWMRAMEAVDGFPVRSIAYDRNGEVESETTLSSIRSTDLEASEFDVPDNYSRQSLGFPGNN